MFGSLSVRRSSSSSNTTTTTSSSSSSSVITVKGASVLKSDCMNTNGVIHIVDKVLMPEAGDDLPAEPLVAQ